MHRLLLRIGLVRRWAFYQEAMGQRVPPGWGVAYDDPTSLVVFIMPCPLNHVAANLVEAWREISEWRMGVGTPTVARVSHFNRGMHKGYSAGYQAGRKITEDELKVFARAMSP